MEAFFPTVIAASGRTLICLKFSNFAKFFFSDKSSLRKKTGGGNLVE